MYKKLCYIIKLMHQQKHKDLNFYQKFFLNYLKYLSHQFNLKIH